MPQRILVILFNTLVVSVIEYGLGLLTLSAAQHKRLEVIQNEGMRAILGCTRDTSAAAMRHLLDFPPASERHKLAQVSAYLKVLLIQTTLYTIRLDDLTHQESREAVSGWLRRQPQSEKVCL